MSGRKPAKPRAAKQLELAAFGRRGRNRVRVLDVLAHGARFVRVQWSEAPGQPIRTESWRYSEAAIAEAKAFAEGTSDRLASGGPAPTKDRTIRELADGYVLAESESWAPKTLALFRWRWGRFEAFAQRHTVARLVTEETLDEFRAQMKRAGVVTNQRGLAVQTVKAVFKWARRRKLIAVNPLADYEIKLAKGEKRTDVPEWSPIEVAALRETARASQTHRTRTGWRLACAIDVSATQGPRQNALFHLAWTDVNLSASTVRHPTVPGVVLPSRSVWWNPTFDKRGEERVQPLTRDAVRALRIARVWRDRDGYVGPWVFFRPGAGLRDTGTGAHSARAAARSAAKPDTPVRYQTMISALMALVERTPGVSWIKGRGFHGMRKHAAGEVHRVTGSERAAADWIGDKDVKVVRKHYLKQRAEEQRATAGKLALTALAAPNRNENATPRRVGRRGATQTTTDQ